MQTDRKAFVGQGTAAVVVASGTAGRAMSANATLCLRLADDARVSGSVDDIVRGAQAIADVADRLARHLAQVSRLTVDHAARALRDGGHLTATAAVAAGLVDEVARR